MLEARGPRWLEGIRMGWRVMEARRFSCGGKRPCRAARDAPRRPSVAAADLSADASAAISTDAAPVAAAVSPIGRAVLVRLCSWHRAVLAVRVTCRRLVQLTWSNNLCGPPNIRS